MQPNKCSISDPLPISSYVGGSVSKYAEGVYKPIRDDNLIWFGARCGVLLHPSAQLASVGACHPVCPDSAACWSVTGSGLCCRLDWRLLPDVIAADATGNAITVWLGAGNGTFTGRHEYPTGASEPIIAVAVADLNGDLRPDVVAVTSGADYTCFIFLNAGSTGGLLSPYVPLYLPTFERPAAASSAAAAAGPAQKQKTQPRRGGTAKK